MNRFLRRSPVAALVVVSLGACSAESNPSAAATGIDAGTATLASVVDSGPLLCHGSTFSYRIAGGGMVLPGSGVLSENGFAYLVVESDCSFWAMPASGQDVRYGVLSADAAAQMASDLRLASWSSYVGNHDSASSSCEDGSGIVAVYDSAQVQLPSCPSTDPSSPVAWLPTALAKEMTATYAAGTAVDGAVRYVLVAEADPNSWSTDTTSRSFLWPVAANASSLAISLDAATSYQPGTSRVATGADAAALTAIRRSFDDAGTAVDTGGYIPIRDSAGAHYDLFVRDSIPLENAQGLITSW